MTVCASNKLRDKSSKGFIRNNLYVIAAFILPAAIMAAVFALNRVYPFGNRMILVVDSWHQYYPFLTEYQQMLKEGSSVMYSWNTGGGSNFLGVIANYLGSPLYLLSAFVPSGTPWLQMFLTATVVLRVGVAGMSFAIFLRKVFGRNDISLVTFSLMYAFCAYVLGYYWNMMWLDTVALMPLVIAGTIGVLRDRKFSLYILSLALSVICSFYIGYMVCLFVLLVSIGYTLISFISFRESLKNAGKMLVYTVVALMITAAVTVPAYMALQVSDSSAGTEGFPTSFEINHGYGYKEDTIVNALTALVRTATNMLSFTRPIVFKAGLPNIACGVLALVLVFFYLTNKKIKRKEKIVSLCFCVFFLLSFVLSQLDYVWHGFASPAMVYYRFSFIFSFCVIVLAYRAYMLIDTFTKKNFIFATGLLAIYLGVSFFLQYKVSVAVTFAGAAVILLGIVLYRKRKLGKRIFSLLLCLFVVCEMGLSAFVGARTVSFTSIGNYPANAQEVEELVAVAKEGGEGELVRTEFLDTQTLNDGAVNGIYGISTFNSMVNSSYPDLFTEMGLSASVSNNRYVYFENTPVINLLFNIKYVIGRDSEEAYDDTYLKLVATTDECALYENTAYVPSGYVADPAILDYPVYDTWLCPFGVQNEMFTKLTGIEENVFEFVEPVSEVDCDYMDNLSAWKDYGHYYQIDLSGIEASTETTETEDSTSSTSVSTSDEEALPMVVEYEIEEDGAYYGFFRSTTVDKGCVTVYSDELDTRSVQMNYPYTAALGSLKKGDKLEVVMNAEYGEKTRVAYYLVKIREDVFAQGVEKLRESTMVLTQKTDRGFKGTINVSSSGLFCTSVLYDKGWKAYVDGEEVEITPVRDTFIAFELSEGEHTIELKITSGGVYIGLAVSLLGLLLFAMLCVISKKRQQRCVKETPLQDDLQEETLSDLSDSKYCTDTDT